jgi:hypothetical protein
LSSSIRNPRKTSLAPSCCRSSPSRSIRASR